MKPVYAKVEVKDTNGKQTTYRATVSNAGVFGELNNVQFAVWSEDKWQDDIKWINANAGTNGSWNLDIQMNQFNTYGKYEVHAYGNLKDGTRKFLGKTTFTVDKPTWDIEIENQNEEAGTFDVVIKNIDSKSGVSQIQIPVWTQANQSDIYWYTANKQSDGTYKATVSMSNHKYHTGKYTVHTYLTGGNGLRACKVYGTVKI